MTKTLPVWVDAAPPQDIGHLRRRVDLSATLNSTLDLGGPGGGILFLAANTINFSGSLAAAGGNGQSPGGAGAGGSIRIEGHEVTLSGATVSAVGGTTATAGGKGRVAVYYENTFSGGITPGYLEKDGTPDSLFAYDFETGSLSGGPNGQNPAGWATATPQDDDLAASEAADYWGDYGLRTEIDDNGDLYVQDDTPDGETHYRARFYLHPNGLDMTTTPTPDVLDLFSGRDNGTPVFHVQMQHTEDGYQVRAGLMDNASNWTETNWYPIANNWTAVEVEYQAAEADSSLGLWLGGSLKQTLSHVDNDNQPITEVRLGAMGVESGTRGAIYFDDFESRRFSLIGLLAGPGIADPEPAAEPGWLGRVYTYDPDHPHAVAQITLNDESQSVVGQYTYDANGNTLAPAASAGVTCRVEDGETFIQTYNNENRLSKVEKLGSGTCDDPGTVSDQWDFVYDGDGSRVKQVYDDGTSTLTTLYFMGGLYEVTDGAVRKYYTIAGQRVAMQDGDGLKYLLTDHLGSVVAISDAEGALLSEQRYMPFGEVRTEVGTISQTDFGYTGQRSISMLSIMDYIARMYDPAIGRFIQPDSIVPNPADPQSWNRFSYANNSPLYYTDPTGHIYCMAMPNGCPRPISDPDTPVVRDYIGSYIHFLHMIVSYTQPGSATEQAWELVDDWYNETGDEHSVFGPDNPLTQEIIYDDQMDDFRQEWTESGYQLPFTSSPTIDEREEGSLLTRIAKGAGNYFREHVIELGGATLGLGSGDLEDNIDPVGGTIGSLDRVTVTGVGNGQVRFEVYNEMGIRSLTRLYGTNYYIFRDRDRNEWGPGGTTTQRFYWHESFPFRYVR